jgi:hypothetical protein
MCEGFALHGYFSVVDPPFNVGGTQAVGQNVGISFRVRCPQHVFAPERKSQLLALALAILNFYLKQMIDHRLGSRSRVFTPRLNLMLEFH